MNEKQHRPDWTEYFLDIAKAVGRRATCLRRRYGAIIVKDKIIISTGYNGAPRGEANCIDTGNCERERLHVPKGQNYELCVAVHAEQNAIINADSAAMEGGDDLHRRRQRRRQPRLGQAVPALPPHAAQCQARQGRLL